MLISIIIINTMSKSKSINSQWQWKDHKKQKKLFNLMSLSNNVILNKKDNNFRIKKLHKIRTILCKIKLLWVINLLNLIQEVMLNNNKIKITNYLAINNSKIKFFKNQYKELEKGMKIIVQHLVRIIFF